MSITITSSVAEDPRRYLNIRSDRLNRLCQAKAPLSVLLLEVNLVVEAINALQNRKSLMPTIAEPLWPERHARVAQAIREFVEAAPRSIDDSEDVLSARLFGLGLRGQDLYLEVHHAALQKFERQKCPGTGQVCRRKQLIGPCECRWKDDVPKGKTRSW